jgi:predicted 3-demethylubiquinone-9 3-methyltransferase (glyoxalase superfamily)
MNQIASKFHFVFLNQSLVLICRIGIDIRFLGQKRIVIEGTLQISNFKFQSQNTITLDNSQISTYQTFSLGKSLQMQLKREGEKDQNDHSTKHNQHSMK